jgi:hypothetical protein
MAMTKTLADLLAEIPPGPLPDPADLERLLAACWEEFAGDDGGMTGDKLLGRMEAVVWEPPILSFTIERHGGTVLGSSRAAMQRWRLDLGNKTVHCTEAGFRQVEAMQPRLDVGALAGSVAAAVLQCQEDARLRWYDDGRVRVLVGTALPRGSAAAQTLAGRRRRFREALRERLAAEGWREVGLSVDARGISEG